MKWKKKKKQDILYQINWSRIKNILWVEQCLSGLIKNVFANISKIRIN